MRKLQVVCFLILLFGFHSVQSQQIDSLLTTYDSKLPQEKLHIHFDNSLYTPGQTIWYKAYLLKSNEPSGLSKNLYIDWFDEKGKFVDRIIAPIINATASGSFTVPQNFSGTHLQVLAYTKWMLNFDSAFLFRKTIPVVQNSIALTKQQAAATNTLLRFFPEGGDLVENISSILAFKTQNQGGSPADIKGIVTDKNGKEVAKFASEHDGMGKLNFTPLADETYTAEWQDASGNKRYTSLPTAKKEGLVLSVNTNLVKPGFSIERSTKTSERFTKGLIVAQMYQHIVFRAGFDFGEKMKISSFIPIEGLPSGILEVTVFDAMQQPLAERILFVNNENYRLKINVYIDTINLNTRGKNVFEIDVPDTIATSLSLAVTDGGIQPDSANNIISQFLLSGEIKGYVHNPAYYFSPYLDSTEEHLDLVMLTNGWRRFKWEDVWAGRTPLLPYTADTNYLSVSGKIDSLNERKIKKAETVNMILVSKDDSRKFIFTQLHDDGSFEEKNLILFDSTKIFYQLNRVLLPGHSHIKISNSFLPLDTIKRIRTLYTGISDTVSLSRVQFIHREQKRLDSLKNKTTLQEVIVNTKFKTRLEQLDDKYASGQFSGHGTTIYEYNLMDDPLGNKRTTILDYLRDSVPTFSAAPYPRLAGIPTAFILNGETGISLNELNTMSVAQIAYVKAFPAFSYGGKPTPFIVIYTKKGKDLSVNSGGLSEMGSSWIAGYTPVREFYLPKNDEQPMNATVPDLRRTIYWKPNIETGGKNTKVKIIFYNNDISQSLRIALEGMTKDGRLIHVNKILK